MPMFEFHCRKCGVDFEELVATAAERAPCPDCGSRRVEKLVSGFAVAGEARQAGGGGGCSGCAGGAKCSGCHGH
jgi:putative FmdB family regulatory protein